MSGERSGSACAEVRRLLLEGLQSADDGATEARAAAHLGRCPDCQRAHDRLQGLRVDVERAATPLDDMRRARVLARLASALDNQAADGGARRRGRGLRPGLGGMLSPVPRWVLAAVFGGSAVAALALWLATRQPPAPPSAVASRPAVTQPAANPPSVAPAAPASEPLAVLQPYRPVNTGGTGEAPAPVDQLEVPAGRRLRLHLGTRATATLIGPARLRVIRSEADLLEVNLAQGTLVAAYDHRAGGQLLVRSPGALTRVVGTLFSVKAADDSSRIVVARGRVLVTGESGPVHMLAAGDALSTDGGSPQHWTRDDRQPLQDHARDERDGESPAPAAVEHLRTLPARAHSTTEEPPSAASPAHTRVEPPAASVDTPAPSLPLAPSVVAPAPAPSATPAAPGAPTATPAPPPAVAPPSPAAPETLYQRAEQAMRQRDWSTARRQLAELIALRTGHPLEDVARYELAQLALRAGDRRQAVALLEDLLRSDREPALRQPAWLLRCELHLQAHERPHGRRCLERFRSTYPDSPHDEAALGLLVETLATEPACEGAPELAREYLQRHPAGPRAEDARRLQAKCSR
jgi:FecR protein